MLHQHGIVQSAVRAVLGGREVRIGSIGVGSIFYLQDGVRPMGGRDDTNYGPLVRRQPWIVEAWCGTREMRHCAWVRCLRTGERRRLADWSLDWHQDAMGEGCRRTWAPSKRPHQRPPRVRRPRRRRVRYLVITGCAA